MFIQVAALPRLISPPKRKKSAIHAALEREGGGGHLTHTRVVLVVVGKAFLRRLCWTRRGAKQTRRMFLSRSDVFPLGVTPPRRANGRRGVEAPLDSRDLHAHAVVEGGPGAADLVIMPPLVSGCCAGVSGGGGGPSTHTARFLSHIDRWSICLLRYKLDQTIASLCGGGDRPRPLSYVHIDRFNYVDKTYCVFISKCFHLCVFLFFQPLKDELRAHVHVSAWKSLKMKPLAFI